MTHKEEKLTQPIPLRVQLVVVLVTMLIKMIAPWEYGHQFDGFWNEVKACLKESREAKTIVKVEKKK